MAASDALDHAWEDGYQARYQYGFQKGAAQPTQAWKSLASAYEID